MVSGWYWLSAGNSPSLSARKLISLNGPIWVSSQHGAFFFFFFNKKQQLYYSISGITLWHHLETSPSFLTLSPRVHPKWKKIKVNPDLSSFSGRRGVGLGSPFLLVPGGQRADPSCAHRTGLQPSTTERTFKQEQSRFCRGGGFGRVPREQVGSEWYFYTLIFVVMYVTSAMYSG